MPNVDITPKLRADVEAALDDNDYETAVEIVFAAYPYLTRDEAVDVVEWIAEVRR